AIQRLRVGALRFSKAEHGAKGFGSNARGIRRIVDQAGSPAAEYLGELESKDISICMHRLRELPLGKFLERFRPEAVEELRVHLAHKRNQLADHGAGFTGRVRGGAHSPQT